ncbi:MAG TPA: LysM peptidoglycan-binding domain-containing protein [Chloroflexota bacterium]|nr:LysM peptidoglycan-binding domain-containing protein [Chloroflexota bacterium]
MPSPPYSANSPPSGGRRAQSGGDAQERLIPFPVPARSTGEPEFQPRRRRDPRDLERPTPQRRPRRRRQGTTPWLQRNALSIAAVSILAAVLGLGFGLLQTINRPESAAPALLAINQADPTAMVATTAAIAGAGPAQAAVNGNATASVSAADAPREIKASAAVIQPTYTVQSGDTLGQIAGRFGTTVERVQALNNLTDPRVLRIGTKLVIPPPL